jgi:SAM-dependent methyltransferase
MNRNPSGGLPEIGQAYEKALREGHPSELEFAWRRSRLDRGARLVREIEALGKPIARSRILDLGAAHGGDSSAFLAAGGWTVAADFADYAYATLRRHLAPVAPAPARFNAVLLDVNRALPFADDAFDIVFALGVVEHVQDLDAFFHQVYRILRTEGLAVFDTGLALKNLSRDPLYGTPGTAALPMPLRRFVAERVLGRRYPYPLGPRTLYSERTVGKPAQRAGFRVDARKYRDSPVAARVRRWPLASLWGWLVRRYTLDFLVCEKRR